MFQFNPKDAEGGLIPDGEYDAQVIEVDEQTSKAGNAMLKMTVRIWASGGTYQLVDYVVNPSSLWKLKRLASSVGLNDEFETGSLDSKRLVGKSFLAGVKTKKDPSGKYRDANVITKYSPCNQSTAAPRGPAPTDADDELAF